MGFKTTAHMQNGYYGRQEYDSKNKKSKFVPLGKAVNILSITKNIENDQVRLLLSFDYLGEAVSLETTRRSFSDPSLLQDLFDAGADVTKANFNIFVDSLRLQELDFEATGQGSTKVYDHLGWKTLLVPNSSGGVSRRLCYRASTLIGPVQASYAGPVKVTPMGSFNIWKSMVEEEIVGCTPAEVVMLASLSAVVNGLISTHTTGECAIVHLNGLSGTGKTTLAMAGYSAYGEAFDGERRVYDQSGMPSRQISGYGSWSATENATLGRCAGNQGWLIVLNELGKYKGGDMTSIVYNLSEGTDILRMNKDLSVRQMEGYHTTILSVGEQSLLDRCQNKADGLRIRILEIEDKLTRSAESSNRIKSVARKNNGHAAPMMAEYILQNGGLRMVLEIYDRWCQDLLAIWPDTPQRERFVAKFPALLLTTAELAEVALGITFSKDAIIEWFLAREEACGKARNSAADSYEMILSQCRIHQDRFFIRWDARLKSTKSYQGIPISPRGECWGRITNKSELYSGNTVIAQEFEVRQEIVERLLRDNGFNNKRTCVEAWKIAGVLDFEDANHPCRKRKIDPDAPEGSKERVFVFRVFCDPEDAQKHWAATVPNDVLPILDHVDPPQQLQLTPSKRGGCSV